MIYDLSGNVWEFCWDWFYYDTYDQPDQVNPVGAEGGEARIIRGGCWDNPADNATVTYRGRAYPYTVSPRLGFRLVRNAEH
jgi:formylglycine-generating enzyme required for sulfatase activity